jgi:response regulator of citrate/malate metabolism
MNRPKLLIDWQGQKLTMEQLSGQINISPSSIRRGLRKGKSIQEIIDSIDDRYRRWGKTPVDDYADLNKAIAQGRYKPKELYYWQIP